MCDVCKVLLRFVRLICL